MEEMSYFHQRQKEFDYKYDHKSRDKEKLLEREIEGHRLILDDKKLDLTVKLWLNEPLENYDIPFSAMRIFLIREFYNHFIVEGNDVLEIDADEYDSWLFKLTDFALEELSEPFGPRYYYNLARDLYEYLMWLEKYTVQNGEPIIKDKKDNKPDTVVWAYYYHILHQVDSSKSFDLDPDGKIKAIKKIAKNKGISSKNLQIQYNYLNRSKPSEIITVRKISIIQKVVELFADKPDCQKIAIEYLNKAKLQM